ncbi:MAG: T9SS type A sorting domain-containing protein [Bacteroidales bacterium]|nr:T9SS type A sorting domain-containing protein [Bacteroidales bacterium]
MNIQFSIYNIIGQKLAVLYKGRQNRGSHYIDFPGENLPSGIYIYELKTQDFQMRKRCLLLK